MAITKDSTLADVYADTVGDYEPSDTDLESWDVASPATGSKTVTNVGLFGADLTDFLDNCATATTNCDVEDYADYNGWAVGVQWVPSVKSGEEPVVDDVSLIAFVDLKYAVLTKWDTTENTIGSGTYTVEPAAAKPLVGDLTINSKDGYFENWSGAATTLAKPQLQFTFQDSTDEDARQVDDESDVWVLYADADGVKSTVTWGGAAQLTAAAGAIAIALLL